MLPMKIEQVAFRSNNPEKSIKHFKNIGCNEWIMDTVKATGVLMGKKLSCSADLYFNYDLGYELEILRYHTDSKSWHDFREPFRNGQHILPSHQGLHVSSDESATICHQMKELNIPIIQQVITAFHSNPAIRGERRYHYIIFDSIYQLGFDLKIIRRLNMDGSSFIMDR